MWDMQTQAHVSHAQMQAQLHSVGRAIAESMRRAVTA